MQFVTGASTGIDFAVHYPEEHWNNVAQTDPTFLIPCYVDGDAVVGPNIALDAVVTFQNSSTGLTATNGIVSDHEEVGALWGVAYDKDVMRYFSTAFLKRHVGLGPEGAGGVYMFEDGGAGFDMVGSFTLQGVTPSNGGAVIDLGSVTRSPLFSNDNYLGAGGSSRDMDAFGKVGTMAYGDTDIRLYLQ